MRSWWIVLLLLLAPLAQAAPAPGAAPAVHAFLDRDQVSLGDTVTLNIQSHGAVAAPDLAPLANDFQLLGSSRSTSVQTDNGKTTRTTQLGIALKPLHAGTLTIPALDVGGARTQALTLKVGPAPAGGVGKVGDPVFVEVHVSSSSPYVGQQVVYTARLFYLPGVDGAWGDPQADGARLIKLDRDHHSVVERNGYSYEVVERSWAVIAGRAGAITITGPAFQGQRLSGAGALFGNPNLGPGNPLLNGQFPGFGSPVRAAAPQVGMDVRPMPVNAGNPWLPAQRVQLKLTGLPANGTVEAGAPLTLTLAIDAVGQPADALPEPRLPAIAGADVYPDQTRDSTDDSTQWLQGSRMRSFAIVPRHGGTLTLPAITLAWWNVATDRAEQATVPARTLRVTGTAATAPAPTAGPAASAVPVDNAPASDARVSRVAGSDATWRRVALASFALWIIVALGLLGIWWHRRGPRTLVAATGSDAGDVPRSHDAAATHARMLESASGQPPSPRVLQASLLAAARAGDAAECEHALMAWVRSLRPAITNTGALREALVDPAQRDAIATLHRVRWRGGDSAIACAAVARAFTQGLKWRSDTGENEAGDAPLPPLYPG